MYFKLILKYSVINTKNKSKEMLIVHELQPKKWVFDSGGWTKDNIDFYNLRVSTFYKRMMSCLNWWLFIKN